tara:strand:- start:1956 stop:2852 length:897 start_codon:yes stop_codon:yes gene_type:complete
MAWYDNIGSVGNFLGGAAAAYYPYEAGQGMIDYLKGLTPGADLAGIRDSAVSEIGFTPYSISTGFGSGGIDPATGQYSAMLSPEQQALQTSLLGQASTLAGQAGPTGAELYEQMQAARAPQNEQQRLALENRLAAQGRLGTQTAAFGGTPDALALEKAIQQQQSSDYLGSQQTAGLLEQQRLGNISGLMGAAYKPEETILTSMLGLSPLSGQTLESQLGRSQLLRDLGIAGTEAETALSGQVAGMEGDRLRAFSDALQGLFAGSGKFGDGESTWEDMFKSFLTDATGGSSTNFTDEEQ